MYWTGDTKNNLLSYCGLVDTKIRASDNHLPVIGTYVSLLYKELWEDKTDCPGSKLGWRIWLKYPINLPCSLSLSDSFDSFLSDPFLLGIQFFNAGTLSNPFCAAQHWVSEAEEKNHPELSALHSINTKNIWKTLIIFCLVDCLDSKTWRLKAKDSLDLSYCYEA